jgi:hypothetical protein
MNLNKNLLVVLVFALSVSCSFGQSKTSMPPNSTASQTIPPPGNIKLLPGYVHTPGRGIDSAIGKIGKENGLEIFYDNGPMSGKPAVGALTQKENLLWSKEQEVNGQKFLIVCRKDGAIYVNIAPFTNFMSVVKSDEELADFLLMIMTYGSRDAPKDTKIP